MRIRREDEEFLNYMKLIGAGLGAIIAVFIVFHLYKNANNQLVKEKQYVEKTVPILALTGLQQMPKDVAQSDKVAGRLLDNINQAQDRLDRIENGFWTSLPLVLLVGVFAAAGIMGLIGGYYSVGLLSWIGTLATFKLIRSTYKLIWYIKPDFDGGKPQIPDDNAFIERDKDRVLPGVLIMSAMGLIGLFVLSFIVYYYAG